MKELEVVNMGNSQPYPMYFTLKGKDGLSFTKNAVDYNGNPLQKEGKQVIDNFINGVGDITVAHNEKLEVGDKIIINKVPHIIEEIVEQRKPGKTGRNHHPKGVDFYNLKTSYTRFVGQTV